MCIKAGRVIARPRGHTLRRSGRRCVPGPEVCTRVYQGARAGLLESGRAFRLTSCLPERCWRAGGGQGGHPDPRAAPAPVRGAGSCPLTRASSSCVDGGSRLSGPQHVLLLLGLRSRPLRTQCPARSLGTCRLWFSWGPASPPHLSAAPSLAGLEEAEKVTYVIA